MNIKSGISAKACYRHHPRKNYRTVSLASGQCFHYFEKWTPNTTNHAFWLGMPIDNGYAVCCFTCTCSNSMLGSDQVIGQWAMLQCQAQSILLVYFVLGWSSKQCPSSCSSYRSDTRRSWKISTNLYCFNSPGSH